MNITEEMLKKKTREEMLENLMTDDVKNVLDLFVIAYKLNTINAEIERPLELTEQLVLLQIDAFKVAYLALDIAKIKSHERMILKIFIETVMSDNL